MSERLTLGALYRELRAGLGDAGWARVTVEFRQLTLDQHGVEAADEVAGPTLLLQALVDHRDGVLDHGEVTLSAAGRLRRLTVRQHGEEYAYSIDGGGRWGPFTGRPRIFDLAEFEAELGQVVVEDATFEQVPWRDAVRESPQASSGQASPVLTEVDALDVSLDRTAFARLLRIFSADLGEDPNAPSLSAYSVSLEAAEDVSLLYWWSLSGLDDAPADASPHTPRVSCSVAVRVARVGEPMTGEVELDPTLPPLSNLDAVWALMRGGG